MRIRETYKKDGGKFPDPIVNLHWPYANPEEPTPEELAMEYNGRALADLKDPKDPSKTLVKRGQQLAGFAQLKDDGSTSSGCWIFCGAWTEAGCNQMARRDTSDPTGIGQTLNWGWAWPANRRVLYNRASCDVYGKAFDTTRKLVGWNGSAWTGADAQVDAPEFCRCAARFLSRHVPLKMRALTTVRKSLQPPALCH